MTNDAAPMTIRAALAIALIGAGLSGAFTATAVQDAKTEVVRATTIEHKACADLGPERPTFCAPMIAEANHD